ncbi:histone H1.2-like [Periplaneta americana]|uniref:histone H1.2-like n=1 Tax=Periplaneta americana TaxID=6978 RepID=UPI0037E74063
MKTQRSTVMKTPKPMQLVISAIKDLRELKGPTPKKIAKFIMSRYSTDACKLQRQVDTALKRGVTYGILSTDRGRYQLEDLDDGSLHMRSHRRRRHRRSPSGRRHRRGGRRGSSRRRRRRHSSSGRRRRSGGRRRRSSPIRRRRRSRRRRELPVREVKKTSNRRGCQQRN